MSALAGGGRRSLRAGVAAAAMLAVGALGGQGCAQVIGAGDYHVDPGAGCTRVIMGAPYGGAYIAEPPSYIASLQLLNEEGAPDGLREFRVKAAPTLGVAAFSPVGALDLGACVDCAWIFEWPADDTTKPVRAWIAASGTLQTDVAAADQSGRLVASMRQVRFVEGTFDNATGWSTVVDGGACFYLESGALSVHTCTPSASDCAAGEVCTPLSSGGGICQPQG